MEGLYVFYPPETYKDMCHTGVVHTIDTVEENWFHYTDEQYCKAKRARELYHTIGAPTVANFKHLIATNLIKNCPVTVKDVNTAEMIFGPSMSSLKGKSTCTQPKAIK